MSIKFSVKLTNDKKVEKALRKIQNLAPREFGQYLYEELQEIMKESQDEVPVDTGALKRSGYVDRPKIKRTRIQTRIGYGGRATKINPKTKKPTSSYAAAVHEIPKNYRTGKHHYLIDPIRRREKKIALNIVRRFRSKSRSMR